MPYNNNCKTCNKVIHSREQWCSVYVLPLNALTVHEGCKNYFRRNIHKEYEEQNYRSVRD